MANLWRTAVRFVMHEQEHTKTTPLRIGDVPAKADDAIAGVHEHGRRHDTRRRRTAGEKVTPVSLIRSAPRSAEGRSQQSLVAVANDPVALARGRLQPPAVAHRDRVPVVADQPGLLQCVGDRVHRRPAHTQHFR
jgi:hypothetical protein